MSSQDSGLGGPGRRGVRTLLGREGAVYHVLPGLTLLLIAVQPLGTGVGGSSRNSCSAW